MGIGVVEIWDDPVYEYSVTVGAGHLDSMLTALHTKIRDTPPPGEQTGDRDRLILDYLKEAFNNGTFHNSTDYRHWLEANNLPSDLGITPPG